jgi:TPR repeat protein
MYEKGQGVSQNYKSAVKWYKLAAEQGHASAQYNLGGMYDTGRGVIQDYKIAVKWWKPLGERGNAIAQANLGGMYNKGQGVPKDYKIAVKWWTLAAEQGDATAQHNLGWMYQKGDGVPQDYKTAVKWYKLAAKQGFGRAQFNLSRLQKEMAKTKNTTTATTKKSSPSYSEWKYIGESVNNNTSYVDFERILKVDGYVYYWFLVDMLKPMNDKYLSFKHYTQGDCKLFRNKLLSGYFHREPMGRGSGDTSLVPQHLKDWIYPTPNSMDEESLKRVCNR